MRKTKMTLLAGLIAAPLWAQVAPLGGYFYGQDARPHRMGMAKP